MLEKGADRGTPEACFGEKPIECAKHATTATGGEGDIESSPEHHGTLNAVTVDVGKDSGLGPGRIERAHSSTSTCSDTTADRGSGVSTAACDGDGSLAAVCLSPVDSCSFYGGDDPAAGVGDDSTTCSVAAVLKRQALLTIVECQRTLQTDGVRLQTHASIVLHFAGERTTHMSLRTVWAAYGPLEFQQLHLASLSAFPSWKKVVNFRSSMRVFFCFSPATFLCDACLTMGHPGTATTTVSRSHELLPGSISTC